MSVLVPVDELAGRQSVVAPRLGRRLIRRPLILACCVYLGGIVVIAVVAPLVLPWVQGQQAGNLLATNQGPSLHHLLGTDTLGRDVLERLLVGTRVTVVGVAEALAVVLVLGVPLGLAAGYLGGWTDVAVSWLTDLTFSIPGIALIVVVVTVFPGSMLAAMSAFGVLAAPWLIRVVRAATLPVREAPYIEAAQIAGLAPSYILVRHVLPRIAGPVIVQASLIAATALAAQAGLAFLGLVAPPPAPSWGGMIADGTSVLITHPWLIWPPGVAIALTMLVLGLLGDAVRDAITNAWSPPATARARGTGHLRFARTVRAPVTAGGPLLSVEHLSVAFTNRSRRAPAPVLDDVCFEVAAGETVGIVGESGCGKTVTATAILGLLPGNGAIVGGQVHFAGRDLASCSERELRTVRGAQIGFVSQEPVAGLNPALTIGSQLSEVVRCHLGLSRRQARGRVIELLARVGLPEPELIARRYPHELSGGMAQRVAIARAIAGEPRLLIADEPTTALDVTLQAEILSLLRELNVTRDLAMLLVTHDWGVVADICDRVIVMYAGQLVERAGVDEIFERPRHPYTEALLASDPHNAAETARLSTIPGVVPAPGMWPAGCRFHPRCAYATSACHGPAVALVDVGPGRQSRCIHHREIVSRR